MKAAIAKTIAPDWKARVLELARTGRWKYTPTSPLFETSLTTALTGIPGIPPD